MLVRCSTSEAGEDTVVCATSAHAVVLTPSGVVARAADLNLADWNRPWSFTYTVDLEQAPKD